MSEKIKQIGSLLFVLLFLGGIYYLAQNETLFKGQNLRAEQVQQETEQLKQEIILPLTRLKTIDIDESFFESEVYTTLVDESVPLPNPSLERMNPFAPTI
jgi:hypothetical protein